MVACFEQGGRGSARGQWLEGTNESGDGSDNQGESGALMWIGGNYMEMEREYRRYMVVNGKQASRLEWPVLIYTTCFRPSIGSASY